jgi:hypothetical protein
VISLRSDAIFRDTDTISLVTDTIFRDTGTIFPGSDVIFLVQGTILRVLRTDRPRPATDRPERGTIRLVPRSIARDRRAIRGRS